MASSRGVTWVDLAPHCKDAEGKLKKELTEDRLHLNGRAYLLWCSLIQKYL